MKFSDIIADLLSTWLWLVFLVSLGGSLYLSFQVSHQPANATYGILESDADPILLAVLATISIFANFVVFGITGAILSIRDALRAKSNNQ